MGGKNLNETNFQGYVILSIFLPGIWDTIHFLLQGICDTVFNILFTFRDIGYLGKLIMGTFASL